MKSYGKKILLEMVLEERASTIISTLDGDERPQSIAGKVVSVGDDVAHIKVGDYVVAAVSVGECFKSYYGKKYKSMPAELAAIVFEEGEFEDAKHFKRI